MREGVFGRLEFATGVRVLGPGFEPTPDALRSSGTS